MSSTYTVLLKEPIACTERELRALERLVRQGFNGSDSGLPGRIRAARWARVSLRGW